jgi:hypothetical protein
MCVTRQTLSGTSRRTTFRLCTRPCRQTRAASGSPSPGPLQCCWRKLTRLSSGSGARRRNMEGNAGGKASRTSLCEGRKIAASSCPVLHAAEMSMQHVLPSLLPARVHDVFLQAAHPRSMKKMSGRAFCRHASIAFVLKRQNSSAEGVKTSPFTIVSHACTSAILPLETMLPATDLVTASPCMVASVQARPCKFAHHQRHIVHYENAVIGKDVPMSSQTAHMPHFDAFVHSSKRQSAPLEDMHTREAWQRGTQK